MDRPAKKPRELWISLVVGIGTLTLLVATLDEPVITWDEGFTIQREAAVREWFRGVLDPPPGVSRDQFFRDAAITRFWPFAREEPDGHPPFYAIIGNAGWLLGASWLSPIEAHRLGPVLLFSLTTGVMFHFIARRCSRLAGLAAAGSWLLMPRLFVHAHLASYDAPLACLWFLCVVTFWKAVEGWSISRRYGLIWSVVFSIVLAMAAATKFTGWLIPIPFLLWSATQGIVSLWRNGTAAVRPAIPILVISAPWLATVPEINRLARTAIRIEAAVESSDIFDEYRNSQQRSKRAAELIREREAGWLPLPMVFLPSAIWCVLLLARTRHAGIAKWFGDGSIAETWSASLALAPTVTMLLCPSWWPDPLRGLAIFLWSNLSREKTTWIPTQFFGTLYEFSLPWYNTLAWIMLTVPPLSLLLIILGLIATVGWRSKLSAESAEAIDSGPTGYHSSSLAWLILLNAATLLVIRALPGSPGHDGERQLLGCFPFLASLAGFGAEFLRRVMVTRMPIQRATWLARFIVAGSLTWAGIDLWLYRPVQLSYYTELIGGLRGAARLGLEPTYYWDALDDQTIAWLNQNTRPNETVIFCNDFRSLQYMKEWGNLRAAQWPYAPGTKRWYVLQNRPGLFVEKPWERWLAEHGKAAFVREFDGVPLIWIFPIEEYENARRQTEGKPNRNSTG